MKKIYLLLIPALLLFSCKKDKTPPYTETITKSEKWGIRIGSSPTEVFAKLQELNLEKHINTVALVYRKPYNRPEEIQQLLALYEAVTLTNTSGQLDRVVIHFSGDKVGAIETGGALPAEVLKWPGNAGDQEAIHKNDPVNTVYGKLLAIYQMPAYSNYQLVLPDKTLAKPFDPDMANYTEWSFSFSTKVSVSIMGSSFVRLFFKNGRLDKIVHEYTEGEIYF